MDLVMGLIAKDPIGRIAEGDVGLTSIFVQLHAATIIIAVQNGYMHAVEKEPKRWFLALTATGKEWYEEHKASLTLPVQIPKVNV